MVSYAKPGRDVNGLRNLITVNQPRKVRKCIRSHGPASFFGNSHNKRFVERAAFAQMDGLRRDCGTHAFIPTKARNIETGRHQRGPSPPGQVAACNESYSINAAGPFTVAELPLPGRGARRRVRIDATARRRTVMSRAFRLQLCRLGRSGSIRQRRLPRSE
jgi:hypothetical protein